MARLIDADALIKDWNELTKRMVRDADGKNPVDFGLVIRELSKTPTVDAVEVVHCKDCKHCYKSYGSSTGYRCKVWGIYDTDCEVTPEHYCSYGERKDHAR